MRKQSNIDTKAQHQATGPDYSATSLLKTTVGAAAIATALLTFFWLPAEHGIDPTGVGQILGLKEMGEIKAQLHAEAEADVDASAGAKADAVPGAVPGADPDVVADADMDAEDIPRPSIAATTSDGLGLNIQSANQSLALLPTSAVPLEQSSTSTTLGPTLKNAAAISKPWQDEVSYTLAPGNGIEVKLAMIKDAVAEFEWTANGAVLNHDTHGDGGGEFISYEKGRLIPEQTGELKAKFTGNHGWFWRNRTKKDVKVTLRTRGDYSNLVLPK